MKSASPRRIRTTTLMMTLCEKMSRNIKEREAKRKRKGTAPLSAVPHVIQPAQRLMTVVCLFHSHVGTLVCIVCIVCVSVGRIHTYVH